MSSQDIEQIERQLLARPFDAETRMAYAGLLLEQALAEPALAQAELVCQQLAGQPGGAVLAARALLALGRRACM